MDVSTKEDWDNWSDSNEEIQEKEDILLKNSTTNTENLTWSWDLSAIDREMQHLSPLDGPCPSAPSPSLAARLSKINATDFDNLICNAHNVKQSLAVQRHELEAVYSLILVAKCHLELAQQNLSAYVHRSRPQKTILNEEMVSIDEKLMDISINKIELPVSPEKWSNIVKDIKQAQLDGSYETFCQKINDIFGQFKEGISITLDSQEEILNALDHGYLQYLTDLWQSKALVQELTAFETSQDAKDMQRDTFSINKAFVTGTELNYEGLVASVQTDIHNCLNTSLRMQVEPESNISKQTYVMAQKILHASNRTESGGTAYERLNELFSIGSTTKILIRPDSEQAEPLGIDINVGVYKQSDHSATDINEHMYYFGVIATLSCVTKYWIIEAEDPFRSLFLVKAKYGNTMIFPLGFTPFHPLKYKKEHKTITFSLEEQCDFI